MYSKRRGICGTLTLAASLLVAGCGDNNNAFVRSVNASPGLTGYTVQVGQTPFAFSLPYGTEGVQPKGQYSVDDSSGTYRQVGAGVSQSIVVYQKPGTNLGTTTQTLVKNDYYTIVTLGTFPNISVLALTDNNTPATSGNFKLRIVQSSAAAGSVDVYLTAPGASVSGSAPLVSGYQFGQVTQTYFQPAAASYEIQVTPHGSTSVLTTAAFSPTSGNVYTAFVLDPAPGSSAGSVLVTNDPQTK